MTNTELLSRITARPDVFGGKPIIRDMRVSVELVLSLLTQGVTPEAILEDYPGAGARRYSCVYRIRPRGDIQGFAVRRIHQAVVRFLVDRCVGRRLAEWLRGQGHDVFESRELSTDPGDRALLERAAAERRILVTIDSDFGELVYVHAVPHAGLVRLPDVPAERRIALMAEVLERHRRALEIQAVVTIRRDRIRVSQPPPS